jgi:hypothetical protein
MKTSTKFSVMIVATALVVFAGLSTASQAEEESCCDYSQCTAFSQCFDDGFCYMGNKCFIQASDCRWIPCT